MYMKTLYELCKPRESVFDETKRDDVLDLTDLVENRIDPYRFFEENFITQGMKTLFDTAFKRFHRKSATGVIKLTQAMGGGKTHNMIALGLLAKHPEFRVKILGESYKDSHLGQIKVVAFTGRESDAPYGIWGAIAEQLGKKEMFKDYYSPLQAPGQTAWINLLKGEPLLILLDELPPYLEYAEAIQIGNSNLAKVTTTALSNLFNALGKEELSNVCLVISDLRAAYEFGSELIQKTFKELENEINRSAINIEPVNTGSEEVYHILRKRLFKKLPSEDEINEIATAYKEAVFSARQMGLTNITPEEIYLGIKEAYPFHPSLKDLFARFKENPGFQQTRGLIRLMRIVVSQLYSGNNPKAAEKYLISASDFDLNDQQMRTAITQIKPSLANAIDHDIAAKGMAIAEIIAKERDNSGVEDVAKLILISSLADVPNAILGLTLSEIIGFLAAPDKDITKIKEGFDEFVLRAWYLFNDRDGKLFFQNTKNLIAELNSLVDSYDNESAKKELRTFLYEKFKPSIGDCYQKVLVFPAVDEIEVTADKVTLVLFEPYPGGIGLHPDLEKFYENLRYKNRIMFLSGAKSTMDKLLRAAKELKAINHIIKRMQDERVPESNPQYQKALEKKDKIQLAVLQAARETFVSLFYPTKNGLLKAEFLMEFQGNDYKGEDQIRRLLIEKQKFTEDTSSETFRRKCEERLFVQKEMRWADIKERAATNPIWQWHHPDALDALKDEMLRKGFWREHGGYIEKPPFPKEKTSVQIREIGRDENTREIILRITPLFGDKVYYEIGGKATVASHEVENLNEFRTTAVKLSFLCVDSTGNYEAGDPVEWVNKIELKYQEYSIGNDTAIKIVSIPPATIRYTTDGSNPKENGGLYEDKIIVPKDVNLVLVVAEADGIYSDVLTIRIQKSTESEVKVETAKPLTLNLKQRLQTSSIAETYAELEKFKRYQVKISDINLTIDLQNGNSSYADLVLSEKIWLTAENIETLIDSLRQNIANEAEVKNIILKIKKLSFPSGQAFLDWVKDKEISLTKFTQQEIEQ
ncbi:glycosyl transferase [Carboxydothermus islandicus]|uniref:Glycosyl transferase n=1 Tax=Carboxydothermus islandicus TaxID=661089 RepID=A0A1L8D0Z7_9THEO|nr:DUF499 domain-containing protein [Carboxydothermus islandicus]GAV24832.1 glycosyl transferase [Carboxydothermus islandicus]